MNLTPVTRRQLLCAATILSPSILLSPSSLVRAAIQTPVSGHDQAIPLFDVTFLRSWQPEDKAQSAFYRIILQPGDEIGYLPGPYCGCSGERIQEGTAAEVVMSGSYSVQLDQAFIVRRPDRGDEQIEAGATATLASGDVAIYPNVLASGNLRNEGNSTITLYGASITGLHREKGTLTPDLPEEMSARLSSAVWSLWQTLGDGDITARLTSQMLPGNSDLPPYVIVGLETIHVATGQVDTETIPPGMSSPVGDPLQIREGGSTGFREFTPGTQRLLRNPYERDAMLMTLDFTKKRQ